mgnify:CR=1 FL=1
MNSKNRIETSIIIKSNVNNVWKMITAMTILMKKYKFSVHKNIAHYCN